VRRRDLLLGTAAAVAGPWLPAAAADLSVVRVASAADDDITPILYAQKSGAFQRAGLDVQVQRMNNGAATAAAVAGGSVDIGKSSMMALIAAHARNVPFTLIAPSGLYVSATPSALLVVPKASPIKDARDLSGKTMPTTGLRELMQIATDAWVDKNGGDSQSIRFIEMPASAIPPALDDGRVDAVTLNYPVLQKILDSGKVRVLAKPMDTIAPAFMIAAFFASNDYIEKNRAVLDRFRAVLKDAAKYVNGHHAETVNLLASFSGLEPATIANMQRVTNGLDLDPRQIQPLIDVAAKYKVIDKPFDAREMLLRAGGSQGTS
jgi:NitT/TauT family transport system substrate-binding protein